MAGLQYIYAIYIYVYVSILFLMLHGLKYMMDVFFLTNRKSFHLLKKNSKLLRELKNLDSRQW